MRILFSGLLGMLSSWGCFEGECLIRRFDLNVSSWLEYLFVATECMLVLECSGHFSKYESSNVLTTQRSPVDINRQPPRRRSKSLDPNFSHLRTFLLQCLPKIKPNMRVKENTLGAIAQLCLPCWATDRNRMTYYQVDSFTTNSDVERKKRQRRDDEIKCSSLVGEKAETAHFPTYRNHKPSCISLLQSSTFLYILSHTPQ